MNTAKKAAPFIVIDGLDGCGKGTQIARLMARAEIEKNKCILTREPGGTPLAEELRSSFKGGNAGAASVYVQFLIMWAARRDSLERVVWPLVESGVPVFSDRGDSSTLAYQVYGKGNMDLEREFWHYRNFVYGDRVPACYIFLDVSPEVARARVFADQNRGEISHFDAEELTFYRNVYEGFRAFGSHPNVAMYSVDGTRSRDEVHEDIWEIVSRECGW